MARNDRHRYGNIGVYDPPEPSVRSLPADARERWDEVYALAMKAYNRKEIAESTAWRTVRMSWTQQGNTWTRCSNNRCQTWPAPRKLPKPEAMLDGLGVLIEYGYVDPDGELQLLQFDNEHPPVLYWDDVGKRLYAFPHAEYQSCDMIDESDPEVQAARAMYKKWAKGKEPRCQGNLQIAAVQIAAIGVADTVSYRSDKFGKEEVRVIDLRGEATVDPRVPKSQEYIHKHWKDVWTWQDDDIDPSAIVIEGGALDVHSKGIIH